MDEYMQTNKTAYMSMITNENYKSSVRNKIVSCYASLLLIKNINKNNEKAWYTLQYFGFNKNQSIEIIEKSLMREKSMLKKLDADSEKENSKKSTINFWELVSRLEQIYNRSINVNEVVLAHWIELIKGAKEKKSTSNGKR